MRAAAGWMLLLHELKVKLLIQFKAAVDKKSCKTHTLYTTHYWVNVLILH